MAFSNTDLHCISGVSASNGDPQPTPIGTCGVAGSTYCCYFDNVRTTNPAGIHFSQDTRTMYFSSLVHAGVFRITYNDNYLASHWQQTVAQVSSLHATSSADALLAGVDFGIMTINMDTAEAQ